jgi:hypothetical protein
MRSGLVFMSLFILLATALPAPAAFVQDRFAIGFWVDPPMDDQAAMRYKRIADAHFTLVIGGFGANTPEKAERQVALCEEYGLKAVIATCGLPAEELPAGPAVWGYKLRDEPHSNEFPALAARAAEIHKHHPDKLAYVNLFPSVVSLDRIGTENYHEYVQRFAEEAGSGVLSFDHYPVMKPGADSRMKYCYSLRVVRQVALENNVPFWNFFNTMPFGPHSDPTEGQLRWQIYTSLAYGAKGVLYFCYYTPFSHEFPKGGAIIGRDDRPTRHYAEAQRINAGLKKLGPVIMKLTSTNVIHVTPGQPPSEQLEDAPITDLQRADHDPEHDFIIGVFRHEDGRRAVLPVNNRYAWTAWPTVLFDTDPAEIREVCRETGREIAVRDDSPDMDGLQLSFAAGDGRLFLLP